MWVVGIDRPYYPSVKFIEDEQEALETYKELQKEHKEDGDNKSHIFISELIEKKEIRTHY